jgi:hypothetical protein
MAAFYARCTCAILQPRSSVRTRVPAETHRSNAPVRKQEMSDKPEAPERR